MTAKTKLLPVIILIFAAVLGCKQLTELANTNKAKPTPIDDPPRTFTLAGKEWKTYDLAGTDIKIDLPAEPKDQSPPLPASYKSVFSAMHIHSYDEMGFNSSYSELVPTGKRKFTIKELADTSMAALKRQVPDLNYTLDIRSDTNAKYNGSFTRNSKPYELRGCCIYKMGIDSRVWAVLTLYPKDNADGQTASQRIIESAVFKGSDEVCK
jgi:hypothetical protein